MSEIENNPIVETPSEASATSSSPTATPAADKAAPRVQYATKQEVIERAKALLAAESPAERAEIDSLKQIYYRLHNAAAAAEREAFLESGGAPEDFNPSVDTDEAEFKTLLTSLKEQRARIAEQQEKERQDNLLRKQAIIDRLKEITASAEEADKAYDEVKSLQTAWKEIGNVPPEATTDLWKNYHLYNERFYDLLRLNHEMRAYDFKKNQEAKEQLIATAESLTTLSDVVSAFHQLQALHEEFRAIGPVAKENREDVWTRFKAASTTINKRHQEHFEQLKAEEQANLEKKTALCEQIEALDIEGLTTLSQWDKTTKEVLEAQATWRSVGFAPRKVNVQIFERFRAACDHFFSRKSEFFKQHKEAQSENLAAKNALCEKAEALKESTDWNATAAELAALQKEWKTIGPVSAKASESVWKRFNDACNYFFERRNAATAGQREEEEANLAAKKALIAELEALLEAKGEGMREAVRELQERWSTIGHVPFRKKEKIYKLYRTAVDNIFDYLHESAGRKHLDNFRKNVAEKGGSELSRERQRLQRLYEEKKAEIQNYETNLGFFNSKSKSGNSLMADIERKVEKLREDLTLIAEKIAAVKEQIKQEGK